MSNHESHIPLKSITFIFHEKDIRSQLVNPENIRYNRFRTIETPEHFALLLGPDVKFASHPGVTQNIAKKFIESQNKNENLEKISDGESGIILTASLVHDLGELKIDGLGHGDISFEHHTEDHENVEETIFERIVGRVADLSDRGYITTAYKEVVQNKDSKLGKAFNAIERIGYLNTGLRAFSGFNGERISNWFGLTGNVLSNQIIQLLNLQNNYSYVREILEGNQQLITEAFNEVAKNEVLSDRDGKPSYDLNKFNQAKEAWENAIIFSDSLMPSR
ncbi:MAG: hypothetical protein ACD_12C00887G0012 [uncultured bacterium]|nr:MAG: hypothetical protein ACD_12C00887G0012 [uncultured bacterium]